MQSENKKADRLSGVTLCFFSCGTNFHVFGGSLYGWRRGEPKKTKKTEQVCQRLLTSRQERIKARVMIHEMMKRRLKHGKAGKKNYLPVDNVT